MAQPTTYSEPDYSIIDPVLSSWADEHGLKFDCNYKGYVVRSIWWKERIQIWLDPPDSTGHLNINAAEKRPDLASQWGRSLKVRVRATELAAALDKVWSDIKSWT